MFGSVFWEHDLYWLSWVVAIAATFIAAVTDIQSRRIPNMLTVPLLLGGLAWGAALGGLLGLGESALAMVVLGFPFVILFVMAGGGAGDAKLMAGVGAWLGIAGGVIALGAVAVTGILLAISFAVAGRQAGQAIHNLRGMTLGLMMVAFRAAKLSEVSMAADHRNMQKIPYGVAIFAGTLLAGSGVWLWQ